MPTEKKTKKTSSRRRRREPEPEPEYEFEEIPLCGVPGCESPAVDGDFCMIHLGLDMALDKLQKSFRKSDVTGALMGAAGVLLFNNVTNIGNAVSGAAQRVGANPPPPPPPPGPRPRPSALDPFTFLGLNRAKATQADVKRVQKALAKLYHADAGGTAVDPRRMAEVNAAAQACLEDLKKRGRQ